MSEGDVAEFLATVPLLEGQAEDVLVPLARVLRRRTLREGEILWRQGDDARERVEATPSERWRCSTARGTR